MLMRESIQAYGHIRLALAHLTPRNKSGGSQVSFCILLWTKMVSGVALLLLACIFSNVSFFFTFLTYAI